MKSLVPFALVSAAIAGLALASSPAQQEPRERVAALEKEVAALKLEIANLKQGGGDSELAQQLARDRADVQALLEWARAQGTAASALQDVLADSRKRGFTAGINPESREVLLSGFEHLAQSLRKELPEVPASAPASEPARPEGVRRKPAQK